MEVQVIRLDKLRSSNEYCTLNKDVRLGLIEQMQSALNNDLIGAIILTGNHRWFSTGADISELASFKGTAKYGEKKYLEAFQTHNLSPIVEMLDNAKKPVIAFVSGGALGGGFELAMGCQYRIATSNATFRLPEISLGIIPGALGTQFLPRLCNFKLCLKICIDLHELNAIDAMKEGIIDQILQVTKSENEMSNEKAYESQLARIIKLIKAHLDSPLGMNQADPFKHTSQRMPIATIKEAETLAYQYLQRLPTSSRGGRAARGCIECLVECIRCGSAAERGYIFEARMSASLIRSPEAVALSWLFLAERAAPKPPSYIQLLHKRKFLSLSSSPPSSSSSSVSAIIPLGNRSLTANNNKPHKSGSVVSLLSADSVCGVVGAGFMGTEIAFTMLMADYSVIISDRSQQILIKARAKISIMLDNRVKRGTLTINKKKSALKRLKVTTDISDLHECRLVVEAVFEDLQLKMNIFRKLANITSASCILCTNTSSLDLNSIATCVGPSKQSMVFALHYFSPARRMRIVEIGTSSYSDLHVVPILVNFVMSCRKLPILCEAISAKTGFIGNRMIFPYVMEAMLLLEDGCSVTEVDAAITDFGLPMGPLAMNDLSGLDVGYRIRKARGLVENRDEDPFDFTSVTNHTHDTEVLPRYSKIGDDLYLNGRLGMRNGKGFYTYLFDRQGRPTKKNQQDSEVMTIIATRSILSRTNGLISTLPALEMPDERRKEITKRLLYPLLNEAFRLLGEGVVSSNRPGDIDVLYVYAYGWPPYKPPLHWACTGIGLKELMQTLQDYADGTSKYGSGKPRLEFTPAPLLVTMVEKGVTVANLQDTPEMIPELMQFYYNKNALMKVRSRL